MADDGEIECWGDGSNSKPDLPPGENEETAVGGYQACATRPREEIACWGYGDDSARPPSGEFLAITLGNEFGCGVAVDGSAKRWGSNSQGQINTPSDRFRQVSVGFDHMCGLAATVALLAGTATTTAKETSRTIDAASVCRRTNQNCKETYTARLFRRYHQTPPPCAARVRFRHLDCNTSWGRRVLRGCGWQYVRIDVTSSDIYTFLTPLDSSGQQVELNRGALGSGDRSAQNSQTLGPGRYALEATKEDVAAGSYSLQFAVGSSQRAGCAIQQLNMLTESITHTGRWTCGRAPKSIIGKAKMWS